MMQKFFIMILCLLSTALIFAQSFNPEMWIREAQERASAVRAARLDALRQLGESVKGVRIDSRTTVKDFVTESDEINAQFDSLVQGAQQEGNPTIYDDGTVTVKMVIYWRDASQGLQQIATHSEKLSEDQVSKMASCYPGTKFEATGSGAMKFRPGPPPNVDVWTYVNPQGKLMAQRAAQVDVYRNMAETIHGIRLDAKTTVKDFVAQSDTITASFNGTIQGVQLGKAIFRPEGIAEVTGTLDVNVLGKFLTRMAPYAQNKPSAYSLETLRLQFPNGIIMTTGVGAPPARFIVKSPQYSSTTTKPSYNRASGKYIPEKPVFDDGEDLAQKNKNATDTNKNQNWDSTKKNGTSQDFTQKDPKSTDTWTTKPTPIPDMVNPPLPPDLSLDPIARPKMPPQPKIPERFVPEWANRHITITGNGAYPDDKEVGQAFALARRAAQVDAYRLLAENALGVKLQSETTVKEFVAEKEEINVRVKDAFIRGAETVDERDLRDERRCEVDMKLYLGYMWEIIDAEYNKRLLEEYGKTAFVEEPAYMRYQEELRACQDKLANYNAKASEYQAQLENYYQQNRERLGLTDSRAKDCKTKYDQYLKKTQGYKDSSASYEKDLKNRFQELDSYLASKKEFRAEYDRVHRMYEDEARAALMPGPPMPPTLSLSIPSVGQLPEPPQVPQRFVPEWAKKEITAKGIGSYSKNMGDAQAMAMARRAAQVDAYRLLAENAMGVHLDATTTVKDFLTDQDELTARVKDSFVRGAQSIKEEDFPKDRYVAVTMKLFLGDMWEIIDAEYNKVLITKYGKKLEEFQPDQLRYKSEMELYDKMLEDYKQKAFSYQSDLQKYYANQKESLATNHPVAKRYASQYQDYQKKGANLDTQYRQYEKALAKYKEDKARREAAYKKYEAEFQKQYSLYKNEADIAMVPAPPQPPELSFNRPQFGVMPSLPKPPQRFIPDWAKKETTAKGIGVYPPNMKDGQAMAMAKRAAQVDAYRLLVESAQGVHLSSETSVKDFLTQNDAIKARVEESFLRGAQTIEEKDNPERGSFEVTMKLYLGDMWEVIDAAYNKVLMQKYGKSLDQFQPDQVRFKTEMQVYEAQLKTYKERYLAYEKQLADYYAKYGQKLAMNYPLAKKYESEYQKFNRQSADYKTQYNQYQQEVEEYLRKQREQENQFAESEQAFKVQYAAYEEEAEVALIPAPPEPPQLYFSVPKIGDDGLPQPPERFVPEWAKKDIIATGTGSYPPDKPGPQGKLLAQRAAEVDAYRNLAEQAVGVRLKSKTSVQDFITQKDRIKTRIDTTIKGAQKVATKDVPERRYVQVQMKLYLGDMWEIIDAEYNKVLMQEYGKKLEEYQPDQARYRTEMELLSAQLTSFQDNAKNYRQKLAEYYSQYQNKLSLSYPICKKHRELYQKYIAAADAYEAQYEQNQRSVAQYAKAKEEERIRFEQYKTAAQEKVAAYEQEAEKDE